MVRCLSGVGYAEAPMSQEEVGIGEPSPTSISEQDRRWAILRWLSVKLNDEPHGDILEAADKFEDFVAGQVAGQKISKEALAKIKRIEPAAGKIVAGAAVAGSDSEDLEPPKFLERRGRP